MDLAALTTGLLAGWGVAVPLGPVGTYLVALGTRGPVPTAAAAALGVAAADTLYASVAVVGGAPVAAALRPVAHGLRVASAAVLVALAAVLLVRAAREARHAGGVVTRRDAAPPRAALTFLALLGVTLVNPATVAYFVALVLGSDVTATGRAAVLFVLGVLAASASWQLLLVTGGSLLGRVLSGTPARLVTAAVAAAIMIGLAVAVLV